MQTNRKSFQRTVLIVEDHPVFRDGIKAIIRGNRAGSLFKIVGEANSAEEAYTMVDSFLPDLILADISLPGLDNGILMTKKIISKHPSTKILMLSMHAKIDYICESLMNGATGYLTKDTASDELLTAMQHVVNGIQYLDPTISPGILKNLRKKKEEGQITGDYSYSLLSPREQEVFTLLATGVKAVDIGKTFRVSPKTIENHRHRIYKKLNLKSAFDLYNFAVRIGVIDPEFS